MMTILTAFDAQSPAVAHACTRIAEPASADPAGVTTVINDVVARVRTPLSPVRARSIILRQRVFSFLRFVSGLLLLLWPAGLLLLNVRIVDDPMAAFFWEPSLGGLLFWCGSLSALFASYVRAEEADTRHPLPLRALEYPVPPLPDDYQPMLAAETTLHPERHLTPAALRLLGGSLIEAAETHKQSLHPLHLFLRVMETAEGKMFLQRAGINAADLHARLERVIAELPRSSRKRDVTLWNGLSYAILHLAFVEAYRERRTLISVVELLLGCLKLEPKLQEIFLDLNVSMEDAEHVGAWVHLSAHLSREMEDVKRLAVSKPSGHVNLALTSRPTPLLNKLTSDLTARARSGGVKPLLGREGTMGEIFRILHANTGNVLLVGDPGCGKSEILLGLGQMMAAEDVPEAMQDKRFLKLDPGSLIAGASGVGGIEDRIQGLIREVSSSGNILLAIEDIHHLLGAGSTKSSEDAGSMLMNALSEGMLSVIATTTTDEFSTYIQPRPAFLRRFQVVRVTEMDRSGTIRVLESAASGYEKKHGVFITFAAIAATYELCDRYLPDRHFPDKALRVLDEACSLVRSRPAGKRTVGREDVARVIGDRTRASVTAITKTEAHELLSIEAGLRKRVIGQEEAIAAAGSALRRARTGLRRIDRPVATLLFLGPTGVGKTETAKALAELFFGEEDKLIRLDLSEFRTPESLEKLLGTTGRTSPFLDAARRCPAHLLLLDEFEKACPDVLNVFLQLFEDGRLTDGLGRTVNFNEALIIATSNLGSLRISKGIMDGKTMEDMRSDVIHEELLRVLRPELVNRFDRIILFRPLSTEDMPPIVSLQLKSITKALAKQGLGFEALPEAIQELAARGYDPIFGARGLRRLIQDTVEDEVAKLLLGGKAKRRDSIILGGKGAIAVRSAGTLL